jgi:hypothetical protein
MWGISYGGFTSIQVAMLRPPHLRAIVPVMATDDRYLDDVHYRGGCVTVSELSQYAVSQVAMNAMPPDATFRGPAWREMARATRGDAAVAVRLAPTPDRWIVLATRLARPRLRRDRWSRSSTSAAGTIPMSTRHSGCRPLPRAVAHPHRRLGPFLAARRVSRPDLDELHEIARFFDRHLDGADNGWDGEPAVVWYEHEYLQPVPFPPVLPGRWRAASAYPHPATTPRAWGFGGGSVLTTDAPDVGVDTFSHRPTTGTSGPLSWGAGDAPNGLARDLRPDEADGVTYTSDTLDQALAVLGVPEVVVHLEVDAPVATLSVRLSDVAPDGTSALVSAGVLNLTHRRSHADPEPLRPGAVEEIRVPLRTAGYRWLPGHRLRIALSSSLWPTLWPSPYPATFRVHRGKGTPSRLELPVVPAAGGDGDRPVPAFKTEPPTLAWPSPEAADGAGPATSDPPVWQVEEDVLDGSVTVRFHDGGEDVVPDGRRLYAAESIRMTAWDADPGRAELDADVIYRWQERDPALDGELTRIEIRAVSQQRSTVTDFDLSVRLEVDVDGERFFERDWRETIPRHLV